MGRPTWPILAVAALLFAACASTSDTPGSSHTPTPTSTTASAAATAQSSPLETALPGGLTEALVVRVVDGDTIHVEIAGQEFTVRYIGMDTPETVDPNRPVGCYGPEASAHNKELVQGKTVWLEKDVSEADKYGRLVRFVWLSNETDPTQGQMVDALLVRDGYATLDTFPPDVRYKDLFAQLQQQARDAGLGLWGPVCTNATPVPTTTQTPPPASGTEVCDYSGTPQAVIKGNISSGGEKIYHVPGQNSYDATQITESKGERWFCTEQEALDAGWRKSKS
jgi:micrococcal nuclease